MSEILKRKINVIKKDRKVLFIALLFYLSGVIVGVICFKSKGNNGVFIKNVYNYYNQIFNREISPLSMLMTRIAINFGYVLIVLALSFTIYTYPLILLLIAYRGAIIGCVAGLFILFYGFNGGAVFFSVALPQNVIITLGIAFAALFNFDYIINKCASAKTDFKTLLNNIIIGFLITLAGAIYEFLITVILIRPMNFYF